MYRYRLKIKTEKSHFIVVILLKILTIQLTIFVDYVVINEFLAFKKIILFNATPVFFRTKNLPTFRLITYGF